MNKYKIYCNTDNKFEEVIATNPPTSCPVDGTHTVVASSVMLKEENVEAIAGANHDIDLASLKSIRNKEIDARTKEIIEQGFVFNSVLFPADDTAQRNFMAVDQFRNDLTYPFNVSTKDDGEYALSDATEAHSFTLTALGTIEYHYGTGRALKQAINNSSTVSEVDAVEDNR